MKNTVKTINDHAAVRNDAFLFAHYEELGVVALSYFLFLKFLTFKDLAETVNNGEWKNNIIGARCPWRVKNKKIMANFRKPAIFFQVYLINYLVITENQMFNS